MATGKTNAAFIEVSVDNSAGGAQDISAGVSGITGVGHEYDESDVTAYSDGVRNFTMGHPRSEVEITGPFTNTATTGAHVVFTGIVGDMTSQTSYTLTVDIGIRAAPTGGDPQFEGEYFCSRYMVNGDGTWTARMVPATTTNPAWGTK